jgi:hypothetical protein
MRCAPKKIRCGFYPNTFLDITAVNEKKQAATEVMRAQGYLRDYYAHLCVFA